jgi:hypothetical protein
LGSIGQAWEGGREEKEKEESNTSIAVVVSRKSLKALTTSLPRHFFNRIESFQHDL